MKPLLLSSVALCALGVFAVAAPGGEEMFVTTTGDDLLWLTEEAAGGTDAPAATGRRAFTAYRVPLQ